MSIILRLAAWEAVRRPVHTIVLITAVCLGVALVTAIQAVNHSIMTSLEEAIAMVAGEAQVQVRAHGDNLREEVLDLVRAQSGIAYASPLVSGTVWVTDGPAGGKTLTVFGIDLGDDRAMRTYRITEQHRSEIIDDGFTFFAQPDSVILSNQFLEQFAMRRGDELRVVGPSGSTTLAVRGSLVPGGLGRLFGGEIAIMDLFAAQQLLGREDAIDQIDVVITDGASVSDVRARLQAILPSGVEVGAPQQRGEAIDRILRGFQALLTGVSALGLFFGAFVSYNVAATGIVTRLGDLGTLRCVGASRRQMRVFALAIVAVPAALASVLGVGLGAILAPGLVQPLAHTISYGARISLHVAQATVPAAAVPFALLGGIAAAVLGAWAPAARAARVVPWQVDHEPDPEPSARLFWIGLVAVGVAGIGVMGAMASESAPLAGMAILLVNLALALLSLTALRSVHGPLARALGRTGVYGRIAADALARAPLRAGVTVMIISTAVSVILTVGSVTASFKGSILEYLNRLVAADLIVTSPFHEEAWIEAPFTQAVASEVGAVPGVDRTAAERFVNVIHGGERIAIHAVDQPFFEDPRFGRWLFHDGDAKRALRQAGTGAAFLISDNLARRRGIAVGDMLEIDTPAGPLARPVEGVVTELVSETGTIIMQRAVYADFWHDTMVNRTFVLAQPGVSVEQLRDAIERQFVGRFPLRLLTAGEFRARFERELDGVFSFLTALRVLMIVLAALGVADTLLGLGLARSREVGVFRALGMPWRGTYALFAAEAAALAGVGIALGLAGALVLSTIWVRVSLTYQLGWQLDLYLPYLEYGLLALATWILSVGAALLPAGTIARRRPAELLAYE